MKKKLFKLVSMILTIAILSQALCLQMFAAGKGYISELRLSWNSKSADGAKQWLWDNGYAVIDCDLNGGTNGRPWVYLGYKTTDNPDEAITDVKIMNMNGGFVSFDTQEELRSMYSDLFHDGEALMVALEEFRQNYWDGNLYTQAAVEMLNMFYLDNDVSLGNFLLYNAGVEDMIELRYFSATMPSQMLVSMLDLGMRNTNGLHWTDKLVEKLATEDPAVLEEEIPDKITEEPLKTEEPLETTNSGTTAPEESAEDISSESIAETAEALIETEITETTESLSYEEVATVEPVAVVAPVQTAEPLYTTRDHDMSYDVFDSVLTLQEIFLQYPSSLTGDERTFYDDLFDGMRGIALPVETTLLDFLMNVQSPSDALPLAASLTDGQIVMMKQQGISFFAATKTSESDVAGMLADANSIGERAYFWEGREEIDYDHGFAMTLDALANMDLSENGDSPSALYLTLTVICGVITAVALAFTVYFVAQLIWVLKSAKIAEMSIRTVVTIARLAAVGGDLLGFAEAFEVGMFGAKSLVAYGSGLLKYGLILSTVVFVVFAIITAFLIYKSVKDFYNPDFSDIPWTIADMFTSRDGVSNLIYYKAVLDDEGVAGDLNAWEGNSWNALYTTKDKRVGNPITADMLAITNQPEAPQGYLPVTHFGKVVAQNTNVGTYASEKKHYIFFRNNDPSFAGSVFGSTNAGLIFGGTGLVVGAALGAVSMGFFGKRKREL